MSPWVGPELDEDFDMSTMRVRDIATREDISDIIGCLRAEYKANQISRQAFVEQLVALGIDYLSADHEANVIDCGDDT